MVEVKKRIRAEMRPKLARIGDEDRSRASQSICAAVSSLSAWTAARTVLLFWPRRDEPDTSPVCHAALALNKRLCLPAHDDAAHIYVARQIRRLPDDLLAGRFGLLEPSAQLPAVDIAEIDFALVPGLAFDPSGVRLGRGLGFYDRILERFRGYACGVAFAFQQYPTIPSDAHDVRMNHIIFG